jgi:hypothetical protein
MLELPGAALGTLPDGRLVYTGTIMPATNNASIESWSPKGTGIQNLGQVHLPMSMQIFSARMSPNGNQICWLTYDINASDTAWESGNWFTRALRRFSGMPYPSISEVAWLSNVDGNNLHVVAGFQESGLLFNKYIQDYDEYIGPTGDEIAWSCDSQFFAFIRGNPSVKRQLYVCKAD